MFISLDSHIKGLCTPISSVYFTYLNHESRELYSTAQICKKVISFLISFHLSKVTQYYTIFIKPKVMIKQLSYLVTAVIEERNGYLFFSGLGLRPHMLVPVPRPLDPSAP